MKTYSQIMTPALSSKITELTDTATTTSLDEYFGLREVGDDDNFPTFFIRTLRINANKYNAQLRIEGIDLNFDPLVNSYMEKELKGTENTHNISAISEQAKNDNDSTGTVTYGKSTTQTRDDTETDTLGHATTRSGNVKNEVSRDNKDITSGAVEHLTDYGKQVSNNAIGKNESTAINDNKKVNSELPMSTTDISIAALTDSVKAATSTGTATEKDPTELNAGFSQSNGISKLNWDAASTQQQVTTATKNGSVNHDITHNTETGSDKVTDTYKDYTIGHKGTESETTAYTGLTDQLSGTDLKNVKGTGTALNSGSDSNTGHMSQSSNKTTAADGSAEKSNRHTEQYSGRHGLTPQSALSESIDYLQSSSPAFKWLCNKLEICFMGVYEI